jgi:hypothetical protein
MSDRVNNLFILRSGGAPLPHRFSRKFFRRETAQNLRAMSPYSRNPFTRGCSRALIRSAILPTAAGAPLQWQPDQAKCVLQNEFMRVADRALAGWPFLGGTAASHVAWATCQAKIERAKLGRAKIELPRSRHIG